MKDATIERLSKIIADPISSDGGSNNHKRIPRRPHIHVRISLAEGWFSLFLLAVVVYSTIWSVEAANWVNHTNVLTLTTLMGIIVGVLAAKQRRFPRLFVHVLAIGFGLRSQCTAHFITRARLRQHHDQTRGTVKCPTKVFGSFTLSTVLPLRQCLLRILGES